MTHRRSFLATVGALTVGSLAGCLGNVTEQWVSQTGGEVASSPAVADGTVYVGSSDETVYALDASDNTEQWIFDTGAPVESPPAVVDGTVYVVSLDGTVYALTEQ